MIKTIRYCEEAIEVYDDQGQMIFSGTACCCLSIDLEDRSQWIQSEENEYTVYTRKESDA